LKTDKKTFTVTNMQLSYWQTLQDKKTVKQRRKQKKKKKKKKKKKQHGKKIILNACVAHERQAYCRSYYMKMHGNVGRPTLNAVQNLREAQSI